MISEIQEENIGNGIRGMPEFGLTGAIDSGGGCVRSEASATWVMLSSEERANASPELRAAITSQDKRDRSRREDAFLRFVQRSDKGRNGGRSGR